MMHTARKHPVVRLSLLAIPLLAVALLLVVNLGQGSRTASAAPGDGTAELHIDVTGVSGCSTGALAGPNDVKGTCNIAPGGTFTVNGYIDGLGTGASSFGGFAITLNYAGVTSKDNVSMASWPDCVFPAHAGYASGTFVNGGCAIGAGAAYSTYVGKVFTNDFNCAASGTISIRHGTTATKIIDQDNLTHTDNGPDVLNINCGTEGPTNTPPAETPTNTPVGPTNTPSGPTNTPAPTHTPAPATATPTHAPPTPTRVPGGRGDVNGDGHVDATDALWVLWQEAQIVAHVPLPENADANHDGHVNSIDALFILWIASGAV